jgi:hypothetical protein
MLNEKSCSSSSFAEEGGMAESGGEMGGRIGNKEEEEEANNEHLSFCRLCPSSSAIVAFNSGN